MESNPKYLLHPSRRNFLIYTGISACSCLMGPVWGSPPALGAATGREYYLSNTDRFRADFENTLTAARAYLGSRYGDETAGKISTSARDEFARLLPDIPYIGGDRHPGTKWMLLSAHWISILRPMNDRGYATQTAAQMMYTLYSDHLETLPKEKLLKKGAYMFTPKYLEMMENWTQKTKGQKIDWVADFIPGEGRAFDWGIDYHHCPCLSFFKAEEAADMAPYFCLVDFPEHKLMGTGLVRTQTLAQGDKICDFRYKKGRAVTQDWATEIPKFNRTGAAKV